MVAGVRWLITSPFNVFANRVATSLDAVCCHELGTRVSWCGGVAHVRTRGHADGRQTDTTSTTRITSSISIPWFTRRISISICPLVLAAQRKRVVLVGRVVQKQY